MFFQTSERNETNKMSAWGGNWDMASVTLWGSSYRVVDGEGGAIMVMVKIGSHENGI